MRFSPAQARLALLSFLAVGTLAGANILFFQDQDYISGSARAKSERAKSRAEMERARRLALEPREGAPVQSLATGKAAAPSSIKELVEQSVLAPVPKKGSPAEPTTDTGRTGRFSPAPGFFDRIVPPVSAAPSPATPAPSQASEGEMRMPEVVKGIQDSLGRKGYEPGSADGVVGLVTRAAIMAYEHDNGLPISGEPSEPLLRHMQGLANAISAQGGVRARPLRSPSAEHVIRSVQQSLAQLGYFSTKIDGRSSDETVRAIREYEMDQGLTPTGRISAPLLLKLGRTAGGAKAAQR